MKLNTTVVATARMTIFMMKKTCLALLSHNPLQSAQSGAVNSTVWCRLKMMKKPYRYADASRLWVTSEEPHRVHSQGLSMFVTVDLYRYIVKCLKNSQSDVLSAPDSTSRSASQNGVKYTHEEELDVDILKDFLHRVVEHEPKAFILI